MRGSPQHCLGIGDRVLIEMPTPSGYRRVEALINSLYCNTEGKLTHLRVIFSKSEVHKGGFGKERRRITKTWKVMQIVPLQWLLSRLEND